MRRVSKTVTVTTSKAGKQKMAKTWITDRWVKTATATLPDGTTTRLTPTPGQLRNLKTLPAHFRTSRYMIGKRWRLEWINQDGQRRSKQYDTRKEAEQQRAEIEKQLKAASAPDRFMRQTFAQLADIWLAGKAGTRASTIRRYRLELRNHVLPRWGEVTIDTITRQQIQAWVTQLQTRGLAARTIHHIVKKTFGGAIRYAHQEGWLNNNPVALVTVPRPIELQQLPVLSYREIEQVAEAAKQVTGLHRDRALVYVLAVTGIRIGEALALQTQHVDLVRRRIHITATWSLGDDNQLVLAPPKTGKSRTVAFPDFITSELTPLLVSDPHSWVFRNKTNTNALNYSNWGNRVWRPALTVAGIDPGRGVTIHKLRHTAASHAIAAGADIKVLQRMLGHANASETLDTYGHLLPDRLDEVVDRITRRRADEIGADMVTIRSQ